MANNKNKLAKHVKGDDMANNKKLAKHVKGVDNKKREPIGPTLHHCTVCDSYRRETLEDFRRHNDKCKAKKNSMQKALEVARKIEADKLAELKQARKVRVAE